MPVVEKPVIVGTSQIAKMVSEKTELTLTESRAATQAVIDAIKESVANGENVRLNAFASISVVHREAREARNPGTGQIINVPAKNVVKFKAATAFTEAVNKD